MIDKDKIKSGMIAAGVSPKTADEILSSPAFDRDPDEIEKLRAERDALKAQLAAAVPEGHVVVPRVATEEMRLMGLKQFHEFEYATPSEIWTAMVEAALGEKQ